MSTQHRIRIRGGTPGHLIDVYQTRTGDRIATGVIDADHNCTIEYPANYGPTHHVQRNPAVATAQPWQAHHVYSAGDLITSDKWGGWMLRCAIAGTSGSSEPDDTHRLYGEVHRPLFASKAQAGARRMDGVSGGTYGYSSFNTNTAHDGHPASWFANLVEGWAASSACYGLASDGTLYMSATNATPETQAAYTKAKLLTNIVKIYGYQYGIIARDTSDNLHHIADLNSSSTGAQIDTLLANHPTAVSAFVGAYDGSRLTLILADGTAVSNHSTINTRLAGITGIECGVQQHTHYFLCLCEGGTRLRGYEDGGVIDKTDGWLSGHADNPVDELQAAHSILSYTMRSGGRGRYLTSGTAFDDQESMITYLTGPPPDLAALPVPYASSPDQYGTYVFNTYSGVAVERPSGFSSALRAQIDALTGFRLDLGGHPIIRDAGVTWHLIRPPADGNLPSQVSESFDSTATVPVGTVSGTLSVNQVAAERPIVALAIKDGTPELLVTGASDAAGDFSLAMAGQTDPVYVLALDRAGPTWQAAQAASGGERVIPTASGHTGLVYECINDGVAGMVEPAWPTETGGVIIDGTISWEAISYFQPQAHGPVHPVVSGEPDDIEEGGNTYAYSEQTTADTTILQVFANDQDGSDLIYRRLIAPADIVDGDTEPSDRWAYTRTHDGGHFWADEYENTIDDTDLIYRLLDGSLISTQLPLSLAMPGGDFESLANWIDTTGTSVLKSGQVGPYDGIQYITGGNSPLVETHQELDFANDIGLPAWAWHGHTLAVRWQQSSYSTSDKGQVRATFLDDQGGDISTFSSQLHAATEQVWTANSISAPVPSGAVGLRIELIFDRTAGTNNDAYFDAMNLLLSV